MERKGPKATVEWASEVMPKVQVGYKLLSAEGRSQWWKLRTAETVGEEYGNAAICSLGSDSSTDCLACHNGRINLQSNVDQLLPVTAIRFSAVCHAPTAHSHCFLLCYISMSVAGV